MLYIGVKGMAKIYYKQQQYLRQAHRHIRSFENMSPSGVATQTGSSRSHFGASTVEADARVQE